MQYNKIIVDRQRKKEQELNEKRMREERELYERKKREEEEQRQEIYAKYDDTIQSNRKKAQDLENEKHEIVEKIIALNANKIQISDRKVVPVIYFPNNSSGIAFISFWLLSLIVGVVGGFLYLTLTYMRYIIPTMMILLLSASGGRR